MTTTLETKATEPHDSDDDFARIAAPIAGVVSAGVAVAFGEFVSDLNEGVPSLVVATGEWFIDVVPGTVAEQGIEWFGTSDKVALVIGTLIILSFVAAAVGRAAYANRKVGDVAYGIFGLFGAWVAARDPLSSNVPSFVVGLLAAVLGAATLRFLLGKISTESPAHASDHSGAVAESPVNPTPNRRSFFGYAGGAAAVAATGVGLGRVLRGRSGAQKARDALLVETPPVASPELAPGIATFDSIEGITPYVVPTANDNFYRIDTAITIPQVDPSGWGLTIGGMVDEPFELTFDEILAMDQVTEAVTLSCVSNEVGGDLVGNAVWTGVPLSVLLDRAGVQDGAEQVLARSVDNFTAGFPTETVYDGRSALLATHMNGEPLPLRHGFPARLVVAGLYGYVSAVKWVEEIKLTTFDEQGYWMPRGWSQMGPIKIQSRIDVPGHRAEVAAGPQPIAGVAWAPVAGIERVEVAIGDSVDNEDWSEATLAEAVSDETWIQWRYDWDVSPGEYIIKVRATDKSGEIQPIGPAPVAPDGAEGYHTIAVRVT
jgi:DMSO/TMAO reductase YedYZ molybdopterin-dependent catalytic subunit